MRVTINDTDEVDISDDAEENYYIFEVESLNDSALKCTGCDMVTIHSGLELKICENTGAIASAPRIYLCTHCGKVAKR